MPYNAALGALETKMRVEYQLHYKGLIQNRLGGVICNADDLAALRRAFWAKISLPWRGATVLLCKA